MAAKAACGSAPAIACTIARCCALDLLRWPGLIEGLRNLRQPAERRRRLTRSSISISTLLCDSLV